MSLGLTPAGTLNGRSLVSWCSVCSVCSASCASDAVAGLFLMIKPKVNTKTASAIVSKVVIPNDANINIRDTVIYRSVLTLPSIRLMIVCSKIIRLGTRISRAAAGLAERESNRIARRQCIFASFGVLSLARLVSCFAKSHQNLSKMHSPAGASSFDAADLFESKSFSRRTYRRYVQGERCKNRRNLHVKTNLVRFPFGYATQP